VAFSARASRLGGGGGRQVYVHYLGGPAKGDTVVASTKGSSTKPMGGSSEHPSYSIRVNGSNDKVAFANGGAVYVHDFRKDKTTQVASGGASNPVISEAGEVVAYQRDGAVFANSQQVSDPAAGTASDPSIAGGGAYIGYETSGGEVFLFTATRNANLLQSLSADRQRLIPSGDPAVSSRANEVFFVHDGQIFARYNGPR
jgi:hypothetical protein